MKKITMLMVLFFVVFISVAGIANAIPLNLFVSDPVGDRYGPSPDLISMDFWFDNATGEYTIVLATTDVNPFIDDFRININLFNPDTGTTAADPSLFQDTYNDFDLSSAATSITLTGTNTRLLSWDMGDQVYINNWDTVSPGEPHPDGSTYFRSGVADLPFETAFVDEDYLNQVTATVAAAPVPEPATVLLLGTGLVGLVGFRKKFKK